MILGAWSSGGAASLMSSARDLAAHTKLKFRKGPQAVALGADRRSEALRESLLKMEEAEKRAESNVRRAVRMGRDQLLLSEDGEKAEGEGRMKLLKQTADVDEEEIRAKYDDEVCFVRSMKHTRRVQMKGVQSNWFDRF